MPKLYFLKNIFYEKHFSLLRWSRSGPRNWCFNPDKFKWWWDPHPPFYKKASPSPSSPFGSSRMRGWEEPLLRVFPLSSSSSSCFLTRPTSKLAKMRDLCSSPSSPHLKLSMDAIRREIQPHWGSPWASLLHLKHFQVSNPFNLLELCFPSSRESPPSLLGALFFLFFGLPF